MQLLGELAVAPLQRVAVRVATDPQRVVVVLLGHRCGTPPPVDRLRHGPGAGRCRSASRTARSPEIDPALRSRPVLAVVLVVVDFLEIGIDDGFVGAAGGRSALAARAVAGMAVRGGLVGLADPPPPPPPPPA